MESLLTKVISLIYENSCSICKGASKNFIVCKDCEKSFTQRKKTNYKTFEEITVYTWGVYEDRLRQGIIELKAGKRILSKYFSKKLSDFWKTLPQKATNINYLVIPVPSHKKRIKERGYCQSTLIAKDFAESVNQRFADDFVKRTKETKHMNSLENISERLKNIKDAFSVTDSKPEEKNILVVDDILTSGSTMCELARTIHKKYPGINLIGLTIASGDVYQ